MLIEQRTLILAAEFSYVLNKSKNTGYLAMAHLGLSRPKQSAAYKILTEVLLCFLNGCFVCNKNTTVLRSHL